MKKNPYSLRNQIALTFVHRIGSVLAKELISYCGGVDAIFQETKKGLLKIPGIGESLIQNISSKEIFIRADEEMRFIEKNNIKTLFYLDSDYPQRLKQCADAPIILYYKGINTLNIKKSLAIVGTRNATFYGKNFCTQLLQDLSSYNNELLIVSGLAYGIDTFAHKEAIHNHLPTVAVLGHGLDRVYPLQNSRMANTIIENGGLITEFPSKTTPDRENFPRRNRIIAGMSDAVVLVESAISGGGIITAKIANSYNRDVFALPGRTTDSFSAGCNHMIKTHMASLINSAKDIEYVMGWNRQNNKPLETQIQLPLDLNKEEELIVSLLQKQKKIAIDEFIISTGLRANIIASALISLELKGIIDCFPGKVYSLI